jgi:hypothetical protein
MPGAGGPLGRLRLRSRGIACAPVAGHARGRGAQGAKGCGLAVRMTGWKPIEKRLLGGASTWLGGIAQGFRSAG